MRRFGDSGDHQASRPPAPTEQSFDFGRYTIQEGQQAERNRNQRQGEIRPGLQSTGTGDNQPMRTLLGNFARDLGSTMYRSIRQYSEDRQLTQRQQEGRNAEMRELEESSWIEECYKGIQTKKGDGCLLQSVERTFMSKYEEMMQQRQRGQVEPEVREELVAMAGALRESVSDYISYRTLKAREVEGGVMLPSDTYFLRNYEGKIPEELRQPAPSYGPSSFDIPHN